MMGSGTNANKGLWRIFLLTWRKWYGHSVPRVDPKTLRELSGLFLQFVAPHMLSAMGAIPFEPTPHICCLPRRWASVA
jgi:hypothetical protein